MNPEEVCLTIARPVNPEEVCLTIARPGTPKRSVSLSRVQEPRRGLSHYRASRTPKRSVSLSRVQSPIPKRAVSHTEHHEEVCLIVTRPEPPSSPPTAKMSVSNGAKFKAGRPVKSRFSQAPIPQSPRSIQPHSPPPLTPSQIPLPHRPTLTTPHQHAL